VRQASSADFWAHFNIVTYLLTYLLTYLQVCVRVTSQLRTVQSDGLILYSGDVTGIPGHDFMAVELVGGRVQYSFDLGGGSRVLPDSGQRLVNDGQWHTVYVSRPAVDRHMLKVKHLRELFHPRDPLHSAVFAVVRCVSVCLSVTRRYCI